MAANMKFSLRFIRSESAFSSGKSDDVVTVKPTEVDQYSLDYLYRNAGQRLRTTQKLNGKALFNWARTTLGLLEVDEQPFATLQLNMTGFPAVLFDVATLFTNGNRAYHVLLDAIEFFLDYTATPDRVVPPTRSAASFSAFIQRRNEKDADDTFKIAAATDKDFVITYTDCDGPPLTAELVMDQKMAERWVRTIVALLDVDNDPFRYFQLAVTGFPDVLLPIAEVEESRVNHRIGYFTDRVLDTLAFFLNTVDRPEPEEESFIPVPRTVADAIAEEEDSDSEEEEEESVDSEDEYADMPALVPAYTFHYSTKESDSLQKEAYSEDEYADMPPLISERAAAAERARAKQAAMDEYAAYRYSTWAPKNQHLFFDEDGDVVMAS